LLQQLQILRVRSREILARLGWNDFVHSWRCAMTSTSKAQAHPP
jgi:hypothetical protein